MTTEENMADLMKFDPPTQDPAKVRDSVIAQLVDAGQLKKDARKVVDNG